MIQLPRLVDEAGNTIRRVRPIDVNINEEIIPISYATMELKADESIPVRSYVELFTPNGSAGIYRVKSPSVGYGDLTNTIDLDHSIAELGDYLITEEMESDEELTLQNAIERIWMHYKGTKWALGAHAANDLVIYRANYNNVLEAILELLEQAPDYYITFNFNTTPWQWNLENRPVDVTAEGRLGRNVRSARVKEDDSKLCTRVYMEGLPEGHLDSDTISSFGLVEHH